MVQQDSEGLIAGRRKRQWRSRRQPCSQAGASVDELGRSLRILLLYRLNKPILERRRIRRRMSPIVAPLANYCRSELLDGITIESHIGRSHKNRRPRILARTLACSYRTTAPASGCRRRITTAHLWNSPPQSLHLYVTVSHPLHGFSHSLICSSHCLFSSSCLFTLSDQSSVSALILADRSSISSALFR